VTQNIKDVLSGVADSAAFRTAAPGDRIWRRASVLH